MANAVIVRWCKDNGASDGCVQPGVIEPRPAFTVRDTHKGPFSTMTFPRVSLLLCVSALAFANPAAGQASQRYAEVVDHILAAWKSADVVCLGEDHGRYFDNELRLALVRHPAFPATVRAVVVEMANPVHQDLLDRFILDGAAMSRDELAPIWRDATNPEVWESPIYEELLRAIRDVNKGLTREHARSGHRRG